MVHDIIDKPSPSSVPVLQVSFIRRHLSLTDDALRPKMLPIVAQSDPCFFRSLQQPDKQGTSHPSLYPCTWNSKHLEIHEAPFSNLKSFLIVISVIIIHNIKLQYDQELP